MDDDTRLCCLFSTGTYFNLQQAVDMLDILGSCYQDMDELPFYRHPSHLNVPRPKDLPVLPWGL